MVASGLGSLIPGSQGVSLSTTKMRSAWSTAGPLSDSGWSVGRFMRSLRGASATGRASSSHKRRSASAPAGVRPARRVMRSGCAPRQAAGRRGAARRIARGRIGQAGLGERREPQTLERQHHDVAGQDEIGRALARRQRHLQAAGDDHAGVVHRVQDVVPLGELADDLAVVGVLLAPEDILIAPATPRAAIREGGWPAVMRIGTSSAQALAIAPP